MGTGRLIGRSFWGFVCSEGGGVERGREGGASVGVWRWVLPMCLHRDEAWGTKGGCLRVGLTIPIYAMRATPFHSRTAKISGELPISACSPVSSVVIALTSMNILYTRAALQGLAMKPRQDRFAPQQPIVSHPTRSIRRLLARPTDA